MAARWPPPVGLPGSCGAESGVASRRQRARQREGSPPPGSCGSSSARWSSERRAPSEPAPIAANRLASALRFASCADDVRAADERGASRSSAAAPSSSPRASPSARPRRARRAAARGGRRAGGVGLQPMLLVRRHGSGASGGGGAGGEPSSSIGLERSEDGLPPPPPRRRRRGRGRRRAGGGGLTSRGGGLASRLRHRLGPFAAASPACAQLLRLRRREEARYSSPFAVLHLRGGGRAAAGATPESPGRASRAPC